MRQIKLLLFVAAFAVSHFCLGSKAQAGDGAANIEAAPAVPEKCAPLPLHVLDGGGGIMISPVAYLVNPGPEGTTVGLPSVSASYIKAGRKNAVTAAITETFFRRLEIGYTVSRFGMGNLVDEVQNLMNVTIPDSLVLHSISARLLVLRENSFDLPVPAVTLGVVGKYNDGISGINQQLGGMLNNIGYQSDKGVDFVMTATKQLPKLLGRPLIASGGLRFSKAEHIGYFGFGDEYNPTFEGNLAYGITDWLWLAGEFRGNPDAYQQIANPSGGALVGRADHWWAAGITVLYSLHGSITLGWGHLGPLLNTAENRVLGVNVKYEF